MPGLSAKELGQQPAFPLPGEKEGEFTKNRAFGLSMREHIAIEMAKGIISSPKLMEGLSNEIANDPKTYRGIALMALCATDALLEQLAKE